MSQLFSICCLPQEIVQAVGAAVSTTSPQASFPERLEQRQRERLIKDDQCPASAFAIRCQRIQKRRFPFHDLGSGHEVITSESESALFHSCMDGENGVAGVSQTRPGEGNKALRPNFLLCMLKTAASAEPRCTPRTPVTTVNTSTRIGII